ncbi:MAG: hypothetical protein K5796_08370 [Lachnospiraceae bacterium]|nr:hypothetical protein [Lachnospiraceae bacterium]
MKKRLSIIVTMILLLVTAAGCGSGGKTTAPASASEPDNKTSASVSSSASTVTSADVPASNFTDPFEGETAVYIGADNTELKNNVMTVIPVDPKTVVLQFTNYDATSEEEIPEEVTLAFTFTTEDGKGYTHNEEDQNGETHSIFAEVLSDTDIRVTSDYKFAVDFDGVYVHAGDAEPVYEAWTLVEYLRDIPEVDIDDFGLYNPYDDVVDATEGGWLHDITLLREGEYFGRFLVTGDLSAVFKEEDGSFKLAAGSVESLLNYKDNYEIYNEETDSYDVIEDSLVGVIVMAGTELYEGWDSEVFVYAPVDLTESVTVKSSDESVVSVNGTEIKAVAPGEAVLSVTYVYGGFTKNEEITVTVSDSDPAETHAELEYVDEKYTTYFDRVSERAVLEICHEDDIYGVDILWADDATTLHHWSYVGTADANGNLTLQGTYYIEKCDEEYSKDEVVFENMGATLTLDAEGCYHWHDDYEDAGKDCIFELPEY